ncbi:MAG: trypsin-like serine protease [Sphingomicrobium sp.]
MVAPSRLLKSALPALLIAARPAFGAVFDADDRELVTGDRSDLAGIGMVSETANSSYGTAFLVGPCHALSARHVVHRSQAMGQRVMLRFAPWRRANAGNSSGAIVVAAGGIAEAAGDVSQDWVLLRLDRCLGATLGYYPLSREPLRIPPSGPILPAMVGIGFPAERAAARRPVIDPECRVRMIASTGLLHDCATMPGNSGGPLMAWSAARRRYEVYAINVAGVGDHDPRVFDQRSANGAVATAPLVAILDAVEGHAAGAASAVR